MIDVNRLRVLVAVADHGTMTLAAAALSCTQPAVSRHIAMLERQAGMPLVLRTTAGVELTPAGDLLVGHARAVFDRLAVAEGQLAALRPQDPGPLTVGSFSSANVSLVPEVFRRYRQANPDREVPLLPSTVCEQHMDDVRAGRLHLALATQWDVDDREFEGLKLDFLIEDEMLVALPRDHPLAGAWLTLADLGNESWIEGSHPDCLGPLGKLFLESAGYEPTVRFHCDDWTGKQGLVAAGAGITLLPSLAKRDIRGDIVLARVHDADLRRRIYLVSAESARQVPSLAALARLFAEVAAEYAVE
ncbi:LysR substrate-binding domain-containing protein [Streptosporangium sp. LJ11]|uniref:LysR family transcriptional regulator n=1 Tax=Streptosporangium sp. LJ11 TaxID=3436927 RepID=UPI003F79C3D9